MFKSDVIFSGYYGMRNTGDDAFVEIAHWGAQKYWNAKDIKFLSKTSNLPSTLKGVHGYPLSLPKTYVIQQHILLRNTEYLVMAGGSIFNSVRKGSIKDISRKLKLNGNKFEIGAIGVSIGPFSNSEHERQIIEYIKTMKFLSVRDNKSYEFLKSLSLDFEPTASFDLAALLPEVYSGNKPDYKEDKKIIGISFNNEESNFGGDLKKEEKRRIFIIEVLRILGENSNHFVRFFIFNGNDSVGDFHVTKEIIEKSNISNYEIIDYNKSVRDTWHKIQECSLMMSSRLHASIFACFADIPFFLIEYHRKCTDFLNDVGQHTDYILGDGEADPKTIVDIMLAVIADKTEYIAPKHKSAMVEKSRLNFTKVEFSL